jgi:hypothetical protein
MGGEKGQGKLRIPSQIGSGLSLHKEVSDGQDRMPVKHLKPRKPHHIPDLRAHQRFETVDFTLAACRLVFPERASSYSLLGIGPQLPAIFANALSSMMVPTVHNDHDHDRFDFPLQSLPAHGAVPFPE